MNIFSPFFYLTLPFILMSAEAFCGSSKVTPSKSIPSAIETYGPNTITDATVDVLNHKGPLMAENSKIGGGDVTGPTTLKNVTSTQEMKIIGPLKSKESHLNNLTVTGPCTLDKTIVNKLTALGPVKAKESTFKDTFSVVGPLKTDQTIFKRNVSVTGPCKAEDSTFEAPVSITVSAKSSSKSNRKWEKALVVFKSSTAGELIIKGKPEEGKKLKVVVKDNSKISQLTFADVTDGIVFKDATSSIAKITGGTQQEKSSSLHD